MEVVWALKARVELLSWALEEEGRTIPEVATIREARRVLDGSQGAEEET